MWTRIADKVFDIGRRDPSIFKLLYEGGIYTSINNNTYIKLAIKKNAPDIFDYLLSRGISVSRENESYISELSPEKKENFVKLLRPKKRFVKPSAASYIKNVFVKPSAPYPKTKTVKFVKPASPPSEKTPKSPSKKTKKVAFSEEPNRIILFKKYL
jgi:hypothetical protein